MHAVGTIHYPSQCVYRFDLAEHLRQSYMLQLLSGSAHDISGFWLRTAAQNRAPYGGGALPRSFSIPLPCRRVSRAPSHGGRPHVLSSSKHQASVLPSTPSEGFPPVPSRSLGTSCHLTPVSHVQFRSINAVQLDVEKTSREKPFNIYTTTVPTAWTLPRSTAA